VFQFYVLHIYPSCGQLIFPCLTSSSSCAFLSLVGLLEVSTTYLGSLDYFLALVLLNECSSEKLMLTEGKVYSLLSLVPYPKRVHFASLTLSRLSTGGPDGTCPLTRL
jgi:hypothetical protein